MRSWLASLLTCSLIVWLFLESVVNQPPTTNDSTMSPHLILPTFFVAWFITAFVVIPIGLGAPDKDNPHHYAGAPTNLNIKKKLIWNTVLAAVVTGLIHLFCLSGLVEL